MKSWMRRLCLLAGLSVLLTAQAEQKHFLQRKGSELYLDSKPFYEISFNKFDLFWQMHAAEFGLKGFGDAPAADAERALKELSALGFKTLRFFGASHTMPDSFYANSATRARYFSAMDRVLGLCDRYDLRAVVSLGAANTGYAVACQEDFRTFITNETCKSRMMARGYVAEMVTRYRERKAVAAWEHSNELLLKAGIGGVEGKWNGMTIPTLQEIARFHAQESAFIKRLDPHHLVTTGDSYRDTLWSLHEVSSGLRKTGMWELNSMAELVKGVSLAQNGVDLFCIHSYYHGPRTGSHLVKDAEGKRIPLNLADWTKAAHAQSQPFYIGEYGALALSRSEVNRSFWEENPFWFESYRGPDAKKAAEMIGRACDALVAAEPDLTHWWSYSSDRAMDQQNPQRMDISVRTDPELVAIIVEANRALQMKKMGYTYMKGSSQ